MLSFGVRPCWGATELVSQDWSLSQKISLKSALGMRSLSSSVITVRRAVNKNRFTTKEMCFL